MISYPNISDADYKSLQDIRSANDPMYFNVVKPHVTLVFSTDKLSLTDFARHVRSKVTNISKFDAIFDSAKVVADDSKEFFHAFLIPSKGFNEINKLHDALYTDELESELRHDIPFIPHIGIGTDQQETKMEELVNQLNSKNTCIVGKIDAVSIVEYDGKKVIDIEKINLK